MIVRAGALGGVLVAVAVAVTTSPAPAQEAAAQHGAHPSDAQPSGNGLRGLLPRVRLFCSPCFDSYAQELWVRSLRWERTSIDEGWTRRRGVMFVPPVPVEQPRGTGLPEQPSSTESYPELVINGATFDPATVYVRLGDEWVNVAITLGLDGRRALPTLPAYIQVQQAPIPGEPIGEWGR